MKSQLPISDSQPSEAQHGILVKRALGVAALIAYFIVMMLLILGTAHVVQC